MIDDLRTEPLLARDVWMPDEVRVRVARVPFSDAL